MPVTQAVVDAIHVGPGELVLTRAGGTTVTYGATEEGGVLRASRQIELIEVDEAVGPVEAHVTGENAEFEIMALELSAPQLREALGHGTVTTTAAATAVTGKDELEFGGSNSLFVSKLTYTAAHRKNPNLKVTIELYRVVAKTDLEKRYTKRGKTVYRVVFQALLDMSKDAGKRLGKITVETAVPTA
jgi:hypothetical protein